VHETQNHETISVPDFMSFVEDLKGVQRLWQASETYFFRSNPSKVISFKKRGADQGSLVPIAS
jgi:hypothetical protein